MSVQRCSRIMATCTSGGQTLFAVKYIGQTCICTLQRTPINLLFQRLWSSHTLSRLLGPTTNNFSNSLDTRMCVPHKEHKVMRHMSESVLSKFTNDIDMIQLKEDLKRESKETGQNIHLAQRVKEIVSKRSSEAIANLNEEDKKKLQILKLEHSFLYSEGYVVSSPEEIPDEVWLEAMSLSSKSQRLKYYIFTHKRQQLKLKAEEKKAIKREQALSRVPQEKYEHGVLFLRVYDQAMIRWLTYGLVSSMQFGIPLVFDMNYAELMRVQDQKSTGKQLLEAYTMNRSDLAREPFHLHLTNCSPDNAVLKTLQYIFSDELMATVTEKSYLDLFEPDRLIYLSPHANQVMREFDPEAVYIIGAFNDKSFQKPVSYARATKEKIKCQRLPIDEHLSWNQGNKSLTIDQMARIMLDLKNKLPWKAALRAVPTRKIRPVSADQGDPQGYIPRRSDKYSKRR